MASLGLLPHFVRSERAIPVAVFFSAVFQYLLPHHIDIFHHIIYMLDHAHLLLLDKLRT